jgi:hypothetical protein
MNKGRPKGIPSNRKLDLRGQKFGLLTVIEEVGKTKHGNTLWKCICSCNNINERITSASCLRRKDSISCGCSTHRPASKNQNWKGYGEISAHIFNRIERNAKARKIEFNLSIEYIWNLFLKQERKCKYSSVILHFGIRNKKISPTASLDRIDSKQGYIAGNVHWIHKDINYMKLDYTEEEFLNWNKIIYENLNMS